MMELLDPPAERDLPPARAARMRADLVTAMSQPAATSRPAAMSWPPARSVWRRLAIPAAAVVAIGGLLVTMPGSQDGEQLLAMGPGELSPTVRPAIEQCLEWNAQHRLAAVSLSDLAVAAYRDHRTVALFLTESGYLTCDVSAPPGQETYGGIGGDSEWPHGDLLPGPVDRLLLASSEMEGGEVSAGGRVSARVDRLVLEHGNGHTTDAQLANGAFGLLSDGDDVEPEAELVSYDAAGHEIDRRPLFQPTDQVNGCYTDPSGEVIYGQPGQDCQPAERWTAASHAPFNRETN